MTQTEVLDVGAMERPADPAREIALSALAIVVSVLVYAVAVWRVLTVVSFETGLWLTPVVFLATLAPAVLVRARTARRRRGAGVALAALLVSMLAQSVLLLLSGDTPLWRTHWWVFEVTDVATPLLILLAWGVARRHGRWWWLGLAPAYAIWLVPTQMMVVRLSTSTPEWALVVIGWTISTLVMVLGGMCCWLIDVLTTRPTTSVAGLPHEHA